MSNPIHVHVVSMAPSITEVVYAVGGGDLLVGVTQFCDFPPEAQTLPKVGGFVDPNYEAILTLNPDLVMLLPVHGDTIGRIQDLGIETLVVDHRTLDGILGSIDTIGAALDVRDAARKLRADIRARLDRIAAKTHGLPRPRVLMSAGRNYGSGRIEEVYVAGRNQWYDAVITLAGGQNAYEDENIPFPELSGEGLLRLDPDVILEMAPEAAERGMTEAQVVAEWGTLRSMKAVREGRIYLLAGDYVTIPGPRVTQVVEDVARVLHPTVDFDAP